MKKKILIIGLLASLIPGWLLAAPCYGPIMPESRKVFAGVQSYALMRRNLENDYGFINSTQYFYMMSFGITDWFCLDGKIGTGNIRAHPNEQEKVHYESAFAGGYGFRFRLYQNENKTINYIFGFHHISVHPYGKIVEGNKHRAIVDDWQFSLLSSVQVKDWVPYGGLKWSRVDYIHTLNNERKRVMGDIAHPFGVIAGIDIPLQKCKWWLNLEGHLIDETAVSGSLIYAF